MVTKLKKQKSNRVVCPKFEILELRTEHRVYSSLGMFLKKISPLESWKNFNTNSSFTIFTKLFFPCEVMKILTSQVNIRNLDRVSELRKPKQIYIFRLWRKTMSGDDEAGSSCFGADANRYNMGGGAERPIDKITSLRDNFSNFWKSQIIVEV